jgi:hypothetical protein
MVTVNRFQGDWHRQFDIVIVSEETGLAGLWIILTKDGLAQLSWLGSHSGILGLAMRLII